MTIRSLAIRTWAVLFVSWSFLALAVSAERPPNIVIIYADDLGWGDPSCYGHPTIRTPNIDGLASDGMRFTNFYSAAEVCTPSRAALLTGRYPIRSGMAHDRFRVLRSNSANGLPKDELTLAELLKDSGYATACIGKWHLGHLPEHLPPHHGFDTYFGMPYSNDMQPAPDAPPGRDKFYVEKNEYWRTPLIRGTEIVDKAPDQTQVTRLYTEEAVKFIESNSAKPFFLYFPHTFPHVPLFASQKFHGRSRAGLYGDVVEELDWSVGQVLDALKRSGVDENTLVVFSSDNGPWLIFNQHGGSAGLLREGKGSTWEGGMRVPGVFRWPAKIPAGVVQPEMACTMDLVPTIAKLLGKQLPNAVDGEDIMPLLTNSGTVPRKPYLYFRGTQLYAARVDDWKAHFITRSAYGNDQPVSHDPAELYHLGIDAGEKFNVADKNPEVVERIVAAVRELDASIPRQKSQLEATLP